MTDIRRAGILMVNASWKGRAHRCLPPEHRVSAVRPSGVDGCEDWIIEGPMMPEVVGLEPKHIHIDLTMKFEGDIHTVSGGIITGREKIDDYLIGTWDSADAFRNEWWALDP